MIRRDLTEQDVAVIKRGPIYPNEFKDLDYALHEAGWISEYLEKDGDEDLRRQIERRFDRLYHPLKR